LLTAKKTVFERANGQFCPTPLPGRHCLTMKCCRPTWHPEFQCAC